MHFQIALVDAADDFQEFVICDVMTCLNVLSIAA